MNKRLSYPERVSLMPKGVSPWRRRRARAPRRLLGPVLRAPVPRPSAGQLPDAHALTRLCLVIRHLAGAWMDCHADERLPHALLSPPVGPGRGPARGIRLDHTGAHG